MKRVVGFILLALTVLSPLAASGNKEPASTDDQLHFVYVSPLLAHPVWLIAKDGFEQACKELGVKGDWVGPQGISPEEMAKLVETAVAQKADAIITQGLVPASPVQEAIDAGVRVLVVDSPIEDLANSLAFIGKDVGIQAEVIYQDAVKAFGSNGNIKASIQVAALNYKLAVDAIDAIKKSFSKYGGTFEIVNISESKSDRMKSTTEWENTFKAYPEINLSISLGAEGGPAAASVAMEMGIKDKVRVYAVDDIDETLDLIRSGGIDGTVVTSFFNYGYQASYWLYQNIKEGKTPKTIKNDAGTILVSKSNIDSYKDSLMVKKDL
ncbi:MAG: substrate-binding domain-containing protein [Spirochaetia bacterium]|jgi:ribose transport system substrate-binding protein|nr:substrate-binding domain-containing protein [Spirochaetia bacterium]